MTLTPLLYVAAGSLDILGMGLMLKAGIRLAETDHAPDEESAVEMGGQAVRAILGGLAALVVAFAVVAVI